MKKFFIGIDPGFGRTGIAVVCNDLSCNKIIAVEYFCCETLSNLYFVKRLEIIFNCIVDVIKKYNIEAMFIEELFFSKNSKTAMQVAHARGVIMLCATLNNIQIYELKPNQVKQAVTGIGSADKNQVSQMIKVLYNLKSIPKPDDITDALAIAWCGVTSYKILQLQKTNKT